MNDKNWQLKEGDPFAPAAPDTLEHLPSHHCEPVPVSGSAHGPTGDQVGEVDAALNHDALDAMSLARFKVVSTNSGFWPFAVVAGDGDAHLYKGQRATCDLVARRLQGAFLDGAFVAATSRAQPLIAEAARIETKYTPPTESDCDEFRRTPGNFNDMVRTIHSHGYHKYCSAANNAFGGHYKAMYDAAIAAVKRDDVAGDADRLLDLGKAVERAARELPEGADLHIEIERGAGLARLYMPPQGDDDSGDALHDWDGDTFVDQINAAIDYAIAASAKESQ